VIVDVTPQADKIDAYNYVEKLRSIACKSIISCRITEYDTEGRLSQTEG
jgi:hypothetical protein